MWPWRGWHCRRKAGASKWTKSGPSGPSSSSCLLFRGPKNFQNRGPRFWDQGVAYTVSPPLHAVSSGDSGTFRLFSWQWAWQSPIQVSHCHHQECIFHMRMRPQKRALVAAPFEHKPTDSQTHSPLPSCEEPIATDYVWEGMWLENRQGVSEPQGDKLQADHATRNYCSSNLHANKGLRPSHLWLRPPTSRLHPSNPHVSVVTPLIRPDSAPQTRM